MNKTKSLITLFLSLAFALSATAGNNKAFHRIVKGTQKEPRVLACNYPEFSFHLPQMAGNFRIGVQNEDKSRWTDEFKSVKLKEKNGALTYTLEDALFGSGSLTVRVTGLTDSDGFIMEVEGQNIPPTMQLMWSFGGCYGQVLDDKTDSRMKPVYCKDNVFSVEGSAFTCYYGESMKLKVIQGITPLLSEIRLSDAHQQETPLSFFQSGKKTDAPALAASTPIKNGEKLYFCFYTQNTKADYNTFMLPALFAQEFNK